MLINNRSNEIKIRSEIKQKKIDEKICNTVDRVDISKETSKPLDITLDIDGKKLRKTITGYVSDKTLTLNIKHTNDAHGNMPSMANLIRPEEFWVDAGDAWQGYDFHSIVSGGREETEIMNQRDCDLAVPGNHFYDDGGTVSGKKLVDMAEFPYLSANVKGMEPYAIVEIEGIKIGITGVRTTRKKYSMVDPSKVKDLEMTDPVESVKKSVEELKAKGIKNIIVLSHLGLEKDETHQDLTVSDKELAARVPGIDLIIGGHTHTPTKEKIYVDGTRIVHAGIDGHKDAKKDNIYIGEITLDFDRASGKITDISHSLLPVKRDSELSEDIKNIKDVYLQEEKKEREEKVGYAGGKLIHELKTHVDSTLGNMMTDALREETGADVALIDSNLFSTERINPPPFSSLPQGEITMKDIMETSLWLGKSQEQTVETWNVKGKTIKSLLEDGVNRLLSSKKNEGLYQVSGLKMVYDQKRPDGDRITEVFIGDEPLTPDKVYKFTTSFYNGNWNPILSGRDETQVTDGRKIRHILADYIKGHSPVQPLQDGRIRTV